MSLYQRTLRAFDAAQQRYDNAYDPSYDEAQGWTRCPDCEGEGCAACGEAGGEHDGVLMSLQQYESMLNRERRESKA